MGEEVAHLGVVILLLRLHCCCNLCHLVVESCLAGIKFLIKLLKIVGGSIRECGKGLMDGFNFMLERLEVTLDKLLDLCP